MKQPGQQHEGSPHAWRRRELARSKLEAATATPASNGRGNSGSAALRQTLLQKRADVLSSLGVKFDTLARMGRVADEDQAQISHEEFISLRRNLVQYEELRLVEEALDRLNSGGYGVCQECEEPIAPKRLEAVPWARYCIRCQEGAAGSQDDVFLPEFPVHP